MIEVPPPTSTSTPRTPSRTVGRNAMSWIWAIVLSPAVEANAVLNLRGIAWVVGWRTK